MSNNGLSDSGNFGQPEGLLGGDGESPDQAPPDTPPEPSLRTQNEGEWVEPNHEQPPPSHLTVKEMQSCDWETQYQICPRFSDIWVACSGATPIWPEGFRVTHNQLSFEGKICIPYYLQKAWLRSMHDFYNHPGFERLWNRMEIFYEFADKGEAKTFAQQIANQCEICQANHRPSRSKGKIVHTPIPPRVMESVAIDLFRMPTVKSGGETFDTMVVCVDRLSG